MKTPSMFRRLLLQIPTLAVSVLLVSLVAVIPAGSVASAAGMSPAAKALAKLDGEWSDAAASRNVDLTASYYAADAIAYPPNEPAAVGAAAAKKVWATYLADSTLAISWKPTHADVSKGGELGFTAGTYAMSYKGADGKVVNDTGKYLCVWKKQKDGSWKAIHDMWNSDLK